MDLSRFSDGELLAGVRTLAGKVRAATAKLVAYLGEVEERRLHLEAGFPSMFAFCTTELGMSENEAFRRLVAARLGRRFPVIHSLLAVGAVNLSALELLRERLTEGNHAELLAAVSGKSKSQVLDLLAERFPQADVPSRIRRLAERIEPLSEARYRVEFTASAALREKLELCRDLMSHANPGRELSVVVERAVDLLLAELEKKPLARVKHARETSRAEARAQDEVPRSASVRDVSSHRAKPSGDEDPRSASVRDVSSRRAKPDGDEGPRSESARGVSSRRAKRGGIARATRRQVFERDGLKCTYVSSDGRRCDARAFLELDHVEPRALGGADDAANLRVRCRSHNQLAAEQVFGRKAMDQHRHFVRTKCAGDAPLMKAPPTLERVRLALKHMGFRDSEARRAVAKVETLHENAQTLALEQLLREALLEATARHASMSRIAISASG